MCREYCRQQGTYSSGDRLCDLQGLGMKGEYDLVLAGRYCKCMVQDYSPKGDETKNLVIVQKDGTFELG